MLFLPNAAQIEEVDDYMMKKSIFYAKGFVATLDRVPTHRQERTELLFFR